MTLSPQKFWTAVQDVVAAGVAKVAPVRATVTALPGNGLVQVQRVGNSQADVGQYARIEGFDFSVNDEVVCLQHNGRLIPIGVLQRVAPTAYSLPAALTVAGAGTFASLNTPVVDVKVNSSPDTASSTDTVNLVDGINSSVVLGAGTWTIRTFFLCNFIHSASGGGRVGTQTDGTDGPLKIPATFSSTVYGYGAASDTVTNVAGGRTVTVKGRYRPNTAGTMTAQNPVLVTIATRTA